MTILSHKVTKCANYFGIDYNLCSVISGEYNEQLMKKNIQSAIKEYIDRVDGTPAMGTTINLIAGIEKSSFHLRRPALLTFLKGSILAKERLKKEKPEWVAHFEMIWKLRSAHMVKSSIPSKYLFLLKCCGQAGCIHPLCSGTPLHMTWYKDGPSCSFLPIPVVDVEPSCGDTPCKRCDKTGCHGHYKKTLPNIDDVAAPIPSVVIANEVAKSIHFDANRVKGIAEKCLLPPQTVQFYINHLMQVKKNRERGVQKSKETRRKKKVEKNR